ncbi:cytochrome c biogenesis CcdA family protein [Fusobacterium varium]|uniref:cytochrome c biogenesis CcdA family protein n=1 Tax=Fusobacterium varium TaxID=856 RepID=UPI00306F5589
MLNTELFIGAVYVAGLLSFFSPCIFPLIPVYIGMLSTTGKKSILKTFVFITGLSTSFILLGFGAGSIGAILTSQTFRIISGGIVILFGIIQIEIIRIPLLERTKLIDVKGKEDGGIWEAFLLGFSFSLGWTPCVGPILASILFISSGGGNPYYGAAMMFIYVLGLATPFIILSFSSKYLLKKVSVVKKYLNILKKIGGLLVIIMGILLITNKLSIFL